MDMRRALATMVAGLLPFAATAPAHAVPGWAQTSANLKISFGCRVDAERAVRTVTGAPTGTNFFPWGSLTVGFVPDTGVFAYCMAHPVKICGEPGATVAIVAFSDNGPGRAAQIRDGVRAAIGNPQQIDCG